MTQSEILDLLSIEPMTARELSDRLHCSIKTVFKYLVRLRKKNLVDYDLVDEKYGAIRVYRIRDGNDL